MYESASGLCFAPLTMKSVYPYANNTVCSSLQFDTVLLSENVPRCSIPSIA